jgi:hypothetical protein
MRLTAVQRRLLALAAESNGYAPIRTEVPSVAMLWQRGLVFWLTNTTGTAGSARRIVVTAKGLAALKKVERKR